MNIGLFGSGFMGQAHADAFRRANVLYRDLPAAPRLHTLADATDELAAYKLAGAEFPGYFGVFHKTNKPTKNAKEAEIVKSLSAKVTGLKDWQILQKNFDRMK